MSHHKRRSLRRRLWFTLSLPLFVIVLMGAIPSHQTVTRLEMAKAVATLLPGHLSPSDADVASLFTDISPAQGSDLRTTLERGLMQGYPDGSFRPHDPVRWAECLQTWTKLVLVTRPDLAAAGSETPWPESEMAILQRAEFPLPDSVQQRRFAAQVTSDEFDTLLDTTRRLLRIAPPTMTTASPDVEEAQATETATRQSDSPETKQTVQQEIAESLSTPQEPAAGFRLRGKLL
ncbi:MAG TPA: S-layer homology domain-containing protein, partial [Candidatus Ozemobacteraceae bacterium]|nr:S-layer homology domain-containing protein [Candidatus Ozemobacteraceae bacterium]